MAPPVYADLGKSSRDVFGKGYHFGLVKLECKTRTASGMEFTTSGSNSTDTGKVVGALETKCKVKEYGLTFTEKWSTNNVIGTEISIQDQIAKGLKVSFDSSFSPDTNKKSGMVKADFRTDNVSANCDVDLDLNGPIVHGAAVCGLNGWLAGYQMTFNTAQSKLTRSNFAIGFQGPDYTVHTNVNDGQEFGASVHHRISPVLETAVQLAWTSGSNASRIGIGAKYALDRDSSIRAKVNNQSQVGLGYEHRLKDGVKLTLSTLIDGKNFGSGAHKLGLALEFEA